MRDRARPTPPHGRLARRGRDAGLQQPLLHLGAEPVCRADALEPFDPRATAARRRAVHGLRMEPAGALHLGANRTATARRRVSAGLCVSRAVLGHGQPSIGRDRRVRDERPRRHLPVEHGPANRRRPSRVAGRAGHAHLRHLRGRHNPGARRQLCVGPDSRVRPRVDARSPGELLSQAVPRVRRRRDRSGAGAGAGVPCLCGGADVCRHRARSHPDGEPGQSRHRRCRHPAGPRCPLAGRRGRQHRRLAEPRHCPGREHLRRRRPSGVERAQPVRLRPAADEDARGCLPRHPARRTAVACRT